MLPSLFTFIAAALVAGPAPAAAASADPLYTFPNLNVTYYYDNSDLPYHLACDAAAGGPGWARPTNEGSTACGPSVKKLGTNAVVALNVTWLNERGYAARTEDLCGREVQIWKDGKQIKMKGGPFFLWDGCQACAEKPRIDMSLNGYIAATGDKDCARGTVGGFDVLVMDSFVRRAGAERTVHPASWALVAAGAAGLAALV